MTPEGGGAPNWNDDEFDITDEWVDEASVDHIRRVRLPAEEQTRRRLLAVLGGAYVLLFALQIGFALALSPRHYQVVGTAIASASTLLGAGLGAAFAYYFPRRESGEHRGT